MDIKWFQNRYGLTNKEMASICSCSLPTIQKWRSGEVTVSGAAQQLMKLLETQAEGNPALLRNLLGRMNHPLSSEADTDVDELAELESSMAKVVDRLELMLESRRKDKEIQASEARYRSMVEACNDPICRWLPDTTLTYVNHAYAKMFSRFGEDLVGRKWLEFVPEEKRPSLSAIVSDIIRRGEPETMVHEVIDKDGLVRYQEWSDIPVKNEHGELVELHSIGRDTTEMMLLRKEADELKKIRDAMMALCEHPVLVFDEEGTFLEMNAGFRQSMLGDQSWNSLAEMVSAFPINKFKRLLKKLRGMDQMHYHLRIGQQPYSLKSRLLYDGPTGQKYLGIFEPESTDPSRRLVNVRLANEKILEGQKPQLDVESEPIQEIREHIRDLAMEVRVDRIYMFLYDHENDVFDNVIEWCAEGIKPQIEGLQRIPIDDYKWWNRRLLKNQWIQIEDTTRMPGTAARESQILQAQDIRSVLVAPIQDEAEKTIGFVGFDQNHNPRIWHGQEISALDELRKELAMLLTEGAGIPA